MSQKYVPPRTYVMYTHESWSSLTLWVQAIVARHEKWHDQSIRPPPTEVLRRYHEIFLSCSTLRTSFRADQEFSSQLTSPRTHFPGHCRSRAIKLCVWIDSPRKGSFMMSHSMQYIEYSETTFTSILLPASLLPRSMMACTRGDRT
jgi:hypothetical protein